MSAFLNRLGSVKVILVTMSLLLMGSNFVEAQILNIEKARLSRKDTGNYFIGNASASLSAYNRSAGVDNPVNLFGYNISADGAYFSKKHAFMLFNKFDYLKINDNVFLSTGYSHFRISFNYDAPIHFETFAQYQYDNFRGLDPRLLAGGALRFRLLTSERLNLVLGTGAMYEYEVWAHPYLEGVVRELGLLKSINQFVIRWKVNEHINFNNVAYFQTGYDREVASFRHRYSGEANLLVAVTSRLSLKTSFSWNYESLPVVPITPFIYSLTNGLQVNF